MKRLLCILMIILGLVGCAVPVGTGKYHYVEVPSREVIGRPVYKIYVDKTFSSLDKKEIQLAVDEWNHSLNQQAKLIVVSYDFDMETEVLVAIMRGEGWIVLKIDSSNPMIHDFDDTGKKLYTLAWVDKVSGNRMFVIRDRLKDQDIYGVMLHEFGHLLGSSHDKEYLMQPMYHYSEYRCVDREAATRVAKSLGIWARSMNYCIYD